MSNKLSNLHHALVLNTKDEVAIRILADDGIVINGPITVSNTVEVTNDAGNPLPVSGSVAVSGSVEITNDVGNPLSVSGTIIPIMTSAGHVSVTTAATGTNYVTFASQACKQLTISNDQSFSLDVLQGGAGVAFKVLSNTYYTFYGLTNANQLSVRRSDTANTPITLNARWEN